MPTPLSITRVQNRYQLLLIGLVGVLLQACGGDTGGANTQSPPIPGLGGNKLLTACSGAGCGAININQYNGVDVGLWQYSNTSAQDAYINIDIAGVNAGNQITLAFSNGAQYDANKAPDVGSSVFKEIKPSTAQTATPQFDFKTAKTAEKLAYYKTLNPQQQRQHDLQTAHDAAHNKILQRNAAASRRVFDAKAAADKLPRKQAELLFNTALAAQKPLAAPLLNSTRVWTDTFPTTPVNHTTVNKFVCTLPSGRNLVFWQDVTATISASSLKYFTDNSCGASGTFARLNTLLGDVWGAHNYANLIKDTATAKQDINIAFLNMPKEPDLAGYFDSGNNEIPTNSSPSNQALVFFVNTVYLDQEPQFFLSTLIHEATHMTAFYQNEIVRSKTWSDTQGNNPWLDETFAMMSEDIVVPAVTGYNKALTERLPQYMLSGANVSLNNWASTGDHYNMGATFGAFLNRRYGLSVYQQLITGCTTTATQKDAYACLNSLIVNNGGTGIADELGKMGATLFSRASAANTLPGYGFSSKTSGGYTLQGLDLSLYDLPTAAPVSSYGSMLQTYLNDTIPAGFTRYIRSNVRVPAYTRLDVVIK